MLDAEKQVRYKEGILELIGNTAIRKCSNKCAQRMQSSTAVRKYDGRISAHICIYPQARRCLDSRSSGASGHYNTQHKGPEIDTVAHTTNAAGCKGRQKKV
jgi:hypothetical protein